MNQPVIHPVFEQMGLEVYIKRLDKLNQPVSGNKYFKLKYNLEKAKSQSFDAILTFGGAFSNHILATAMAGAEHRLRTIGVIRGEELVDRWQHNPTLLKASGAGMDFKFVSRHQYRDKYNEEFIDQLETQYGPFYLVPEGGTNKLAVKGCEEILQLADRDFDIISCAVGTGGTLAGIANSASSSQRVLGFASLKGDFLKEDICKFTAVKNWELSGEYHFGGYARVTKELVDFINGFRKKCGIQLDPVYTGKMVFGIIDLAKKGQFNRGTSILMLHTGGLQGIEGMNTILKKKNLPLIGL